MRAKIVGLALVVGFGITGLTLFRNSNSEEKAQPTTIAAENLPSKSSEGTASPASVPAEATKKAGPTSAQPAFQELAKEESSNQNQAILKNVENLVREGNPGKAADLLSQKLGSDPENYELRAELAFLQSKNLNNPEAAKANFEQALLANPTNGEAMKELVSLYSSEGNFAAGTRYLNKVLESHPDNLHSHLAMAELYEKQGKLADAISWAERGTRLPNAESEGANYLAYLLDKSNHPQEAEDLFQQALKQRDQEGKPPIPEVNHKL